MSMKKENIANYYKAKSREKYKLEERQKYIKKKIYEKYEEQRKEEYIKRKAYERCEEQRKEEYIKRKAYERCEEQRKEEYIKRKAYERCEEKRIESLCTYGVYKNNIEKAFHNCFVREKNFKGYINEFEEIIEKTFKKGMNWNNYGKWEIDHIIPLAKGGEHSINNIQALWKKENRSKGSKIINILLSKIIKKQNVKKKEE
jgi:5-methylcytosine-specific restriction endonuclease McrA